MRYNEICTYISSLMARTKKTPKKQKPAMHSVSLTPDVVEILWDLSRDAADVLGRAISKSAILRALVRQVRKQGPAAREALFLEIERELNVGVTWGRKAKKGDSRK